MRALGIGLVVLLVLAGLGAPPRALADDGGPVVDGCRADLAARLGVPAGDVTLVRATPTVFPDAALGLPRPGEMVAQVQTPGFVVVFAVGPRAWFYTANESARRYGGPLDAWGDALLALLPRSEEPNLNGELVDLSLLGTNPRPLIAGVSAFTPQRDGSILATRRVSRSGFVLLHLAVGADAQAQEIHGAFDYGEARMSPDGSGTWAALARSRVGTPWAVVRSRLGAGPDEAAWIALPEGMKPTRLDWDGEALVVADANVRWSRLEATSEGTAWRRLDAYAPPGSSDFMLNKSESVVVKTETVDGKVRTRVVREWFNGDEKPIATIEGLAFDAAEITPSKGFVLVRGRAGETRKAYVVDVQSHEVHEVPEEVASGARLRAARPGGWHALEPLLGLPR